MFSDRYKYKLPELPYSVDALEPYIDAMTMQIHHNKHHQGYVNNLNAALENHPELQKVDLITMLKDLDKVPEDVRTAVRNNGGGHFNHSMFWQIMKKDGGGEPKSKVAEEIKKSFGSFDAFKEIFNNNSKKVFGSGWSWLSLDKNGKLVATTSTNQDTPMAEGLTPIMGLDVWEHAYYLQYQNRRPDYINAWWNVINWDQIEENYRNKF
ncbi:superoxide dismutase [candidate division TM6 bacterium RIFCSPHIGHO2_12_FULL_32_22]|nr:MAG: superoxide dismutase [candidate division TM6 bacterium RIFCSPHIGHO2_12_FULL_32_22]